MKNSIKPKKTSLKKIVIKKPSTSTQNKSYGSKKNKKVTKQTNIPEKVKKARKKFQKSTHKSLKLKIIAIQTDMKKKDLFSSNNISSSSNSNNSNNNSKRKKKKKFSKFLYNSLSKKTRKNYKFNKYN